MDLPTTKALSINISFSRSARKIMHDALSIGALAQKANIPLNIDLRHGHDIPKTITGIILRGAVGCNLEDQDQTTQLVSKKLMLSRIEVTLQTAASLEVPDFVVTARCNALYHGGTIEDTIDRGRAYLEAGATTVFVWSGHRGSEVRREEIKQLVKASNGRLAVKMNLLPGSLTLSELKELGVARISVGGGLYTKAMAASKEAA